MDIFKFTNPENVTKMEQGQIINNLKSKMWIERYRDSGEFTLVAPADSDMRSILPIGSFISHVDTTEVMIVENHEISDDRGTESDITITGRGFETFFENRVVGSNKVFPVSGTLTEFGLAADETWNQAVQLVNNHITTGLLVDDNNTLYYVECKTLLTGVGDQVGRGFPRGSLYDALLNLLAIDNLGIKLVRPGPWSPLTPAGSPNLGIIIHKGVDRSQSIVFSYDTGEVETADYLWSNKKLKNAALVSGKWVETAVIPPQLRYFRRWMFVNATDIDQDLNAAPVGAALTTIVNSMQQRGKEALASQKEIALAKADVAKQSTHAVYRKDYNVGDLITIDGDYNEVSVMRVNEYVEIEDETGESGYPTLAMD